MGDRPSAFLFGGDDVAIDGTRPAGSSQADAQNLTSLRRGSTIRGILKGTFTRKSLEHMATSEQEQADDQRYYLQQRKEASKFTMVRAAAAPWVAVPTGWGHSTATEWA